MLHPFLRDKFSIRTARAFAFVLGLAFLFSSTLLADTLILKDGTVVEGEIVEERSEEVIIKVKFGEVSYSRSEIQEIKRGNEEESTEDVTNLRDVITLKSGQKHYGLIVKKDNAEVEIELLASGKNVSQNILIRTKFAKTEIQEIKEITPEQRTQVRTYLATVKDDKKKDEEAMATLKIEDIEWDAKDTRTRKMPAKRIELEHFLIESNTPETFLREAVYQMSKVFDLYKEHFGVDRNQDEKIRVLIFNSMESYYKSLDLKIKNPAFYAPEPNLIAAGCEYAQYERDITRIKKEMEVLNRNLEKAKKKLFDYRVEVRKWVTEAHDDIYKANGLSEGEKKLLWENIRTQQVKWQMNVGQYEKQVNEIQEDIEKANRHNANLFKEYTEEMIKTMYHEGFHAFLQNFLFSEEEAAFVPRWLNEGLAVYFEEARVEGKRFILGKDIREKSNFLRNMKRKGKLISVVQLINGDADAYMVTSTEDKADMETSSMYYGYSWYLVHWLGEKGRLKKEYLSEYVTQLKDKMSFEEALPTLSGMTNEALQKEMDEALKYNFGFTAPTTDTKDTKTK